MPIFQRHRVSQQPSLAARRHMSGAAMVEMAVIGVVIIAFLTLGMVQLILIGHARVTLNYATLLAAREGAVDHARVEPMEKGLADGLAPMFGAKAASNQGRVGGGHPLRYALPANGGGYRQLSTYRGQEWLHPANPIRKEAAEVASDLSNVGDASALGSAAASLAADDVEKYAHIIIANPTTEAFNDFARDIHIADGKRGIPNAGLYRMTGKGTRQTDVQVCTPAATPTEDDPRPPLEIQTPSKSDLEDALLGGVADESWSSLSFNGDPDLSVSADFKQDVRHMIEDTDLTDSAAAIGMYNDIKERANQFVSNHPDLPGWQTGQAQSVAAMADILAQSTAGPTRPSADQIRQALGSTGPTDEVYLDSGSSGFRDQWDTWTCGDPGYNQSGLGCTGGKETDDSLWGQIDNAFEASPTDVNYTDLADSIAHRSAEFGNNTSMSDPQRSFVGHVNSFFHILSQSRQIGPYRHSETCHTETVYENAPPAVGQASGENIQDANLLKIEVVYGYKLIVPLVGPAIVRLIKQFGSSPAGGIDQALVDKIYEDGRIPLTATATVRMQTPAFKNDSMLSRDSSFFQ